MSSSVPRDMHAKKEYMPKEYSIKETCTRVRKKKIIINILDNYPNLIITFFYTISYGRHILIGGKLV